MFSQKSDMVKSKKKILKFVRMCHCHTLLIVGDFKVVVGLPLPLIDTLVVAPIHKFVNCHFVEIGFGVKD